MEIFTFSLRVQARYVAFSVGTWGSRLSSFQKLGWCCTDGKLNVPGNRLELNGRIAATLAAPVLMVLDAWDDINVDDLVDKALLSKNGLEEQRCEVLGLIVNKVNESHTWCRRCESCFSDGCISKKSA